MQRIQEILIKRDSMRLRSDGTWGPERSLSRMIDCSDERLSKQ